MEENDPSLSGSVPVPGQARTIPLAFIARAKATPDALAYRWHDGSSWRQLTWSELAEKVADRRARMKIEGLSPGDRVGILMPNGPEWVISDLAAQSEGLVTVPLYVRDSAENVIHVMRDSGISLCIADAVQRWKQLGADPDALPDLRRVWTLGDDAPAEDPLIATPPDDVPTAVPSEPAEREPADLATIVYTSGTTGPPKGVMLSDRALMWNATAVMQVISIESEDEFLSILPLAHGFERSLGWLCPLLAGASVTFSRSVETLREDMQAVSPTIMLAVPRLFDKLREAALAKVKGSSFNTWAFETALKIGWQRRLAAEGTERAPGLLGRLFWNVFGRKIAERVNGAFGSRLRVVLSGGAPMSPETSRFMAAMQIPLIEGYGLTEAGPAVTGSTLDDRRIGSVGRPLPGAEVRIGEAEELLVKSPGVMLGYWGNPEATKRSFTEDGWLRTGDRAELIDGRVYIRGRLKDLIVLSTGENVNPSPILDAMLEDALVEQAVVLGDNRPRCAAVVVVDAPAFESWRSGKGLGGKDKDHKDVRAAMLQRLLARMESIPPFARICGVHIETSPWTADDGLITGYIAAAEARIVAHLRRDLDAEFPAGWPDDILQALRFLVAHYYLNREATARNGDVIEMALGVDDLLAPWRDLSA